MNLKVKEFWKSVRIC